VVNSVGVGEENLLPRLQVFPNPNTGTFYVEIPSTDSFKTVELYDVSGRKIRINISQSEGHLSISTQASKGIYVIRLVTESGSVRKHLISIE
jgi:hypothetical protein